MTQDSVPTAGFDPAAIEAELATMRAPLADFLSRAGIDDTTWRRWKKRQYEPRRESERKVMHALRAIRNERRGADPPPAGEATAPG